ncbi:hypothetical protein SEES8400_06216 [Salmonella enterica subsp. enterica serovar Senftenberg str. ATCC 8400]|nr:hypothetical protein SEES8400_06216 [Salmonella enterica subsp. enterica serovar Senftenberg str. ATCC 8400]
MSRIRCSEGYAGLSPLARGTPIGDGYAFRGFRFIPAGAGNTPLQG